MNLFPVRVSRDQAQQYLLNRFPLSKSASLETVPEVGIDGSELIFSHTDLLISIGHQKFDSLLKDPAIAKKRNRPSRD